MKIQRLFALRPILRPILRRVVRAIFRPVPSPILLLTLGGSTLLLSGCASHSRAYAAVHAADRYRQTSQSDSLDRRRRVCYTAPLAASRARLQLPLDSLGRLPRGAAYVRKEGQASAIVRFQQDTLYIEARCDSLQTLVYAYEEEIRRLASGSAGEEIHRAGAGGQKESRAPATSRWWFWGILGLAAGCFFRFRN